MSATFIFEVASTPVAIEVALFKINGTARNVNAAVSIMCGDGSHLLEINF
jgi:hypothetical protein